MKTTIINPINQISHILEELGYGKGLRCGHILYDKLINNNYDYQIIRESSHDGTFLFTNQLINRALLPLINGQAYCKKTISEEDVKYVKDINYKIGDIRLESEFGEVNGYPGVTDTVYIPVVCEYIFEQKLLQ